MLQAKTRHIKYESVGIYVVKFAKIYSNCGPPIPPRHPHRNTPQNVLQAGLASVLVSPNSSQILWILTKLVETHSLFTSLFKNHGRFCWVLGVTWFGFAALPLCDFAKWNNENFSVAASCEFIVGPPLASAAASPGFLRQTILLCLSFPGDSRITMAHSNPWSSKEVFDKA